MDKEKYLQRISDLETENKIFKATLEQFEQLQSRLTECERERDEFAVKFYKWSVERYIDEWFDVPDTPPIEDRLEQFKAINLQFKQSLKSENNEK